MGQETKKQVCDFCGGDGQERSFRGESRFLLSVDDCPVCGGMGFIVDPTDDGPTAGQEPAGPRGSRKGGDS